jgi:stage V sporulation protein B
LFSGTATTVINLPVAVCYGLATVAIPAVSGAKTEKAKRLNTVRVMLFTIILAVPLAIICCVFSPLAVRVLFSRLNEVNKAVTVSLIRSLSINVIFLSLLQTENAVLIGRGKPLFALIGTSIGIVVKIILNTILLKIPSLNIYGAVIGVIACYFIACLINLILIIKTKVSDASKTPYGG